MKKQRDVLEVALEVGRLVYANAQGRPSLILAYATAATVAFAGTAVGYGAWRKIPWKRSS